MSIFILILATLCFAGQFAFTKVFEGSVRQTGVTALVMLTLTSIIGSLLYLIIGLFEIDFSWFSFFWALAFAAVMIPYYMIGIKVLSLGALAVYSMFMMLGGMLIPFFYGIVFLHEDISVGKIFGSILLVFFIVFQAVSQSPCEENRNNASGKCRRWLFFTLCILIFFINGMTGVITKAHEIGEAAVDEVSFTVLYTAMTAIISMIMLVLSLTGRNLKGKISEMKSVFHIKPALAVLGIGASAYTGNFLLLLAASKVAASVQFPLVSGGVIAVSALVSVFVFKEKISKHELISVAGAFASTFLFAL